ncbi:sporulation integral membrane protein YtvI [Alkalihalobacillus sp. LMS39]|uniref:sporulation integral membrane protein YtvI n=1 Tax=Alkalihalobacillus sp. LMS39 TaxID=2924032 RepID=UPI001FB51996|nr:sporulation integral membrane protein YtvI [Alkalihalobacillus sp. LMS39]UOE95299.1 sporulation integral membrane protein YtvI [Alkalihalobacillus sp. LMS39]
MAEHKVLQMIIRLFIVVALFIIGLVAFYYVVWLTYPFIIAGMIAFLLNPVANFLERKARFPRTLAVLSGILFLFGLVGSAITLLIIKLIDGFHYLSQLVPKHIETISIHIQTYVNEQVLPLWGRAIGLIDELDETQRDAVGNSIQQLGGQFATLLANAGQAIANSLSHFIGALPITLTVVVFIILALYFMSKDWNDLTKAVKDKLPTKALKQMSDIFKDLKSKLFGFVRAQFILISMTAVVNFIGLLILNVEQALTIALILGVVDLLPYLGTGLILVPWGIYSIVTGNLFLGFGLLILYGLTVTLRQVAEPKVLSSSLGLNPLTTLISLFVGLQLFGFIGLFIGPVLLILFLSLYKAKVFDGIWMFIKGNSQVK